MKAVYGGLIQRNSPTASTLSTTHAATSQTMARSSRPRHADVRINP